MNQDELNIRQSPMKITFNSLPILPNSHTGRSKVNTARGFTAKKEGDDISLHCVHSLNVLDYYSGKAIYQLEAQKSFLIKSINKAATVKASCGLALLSIKEFNGILTKTESIFTIGNTYKEPSFEELCPQIIGVYGFLDGEPTSCSEFVRVDSVFPQN